MSILVTADLHLSENPRDDYRFGFFNIVREFIYKHKVDHLMILGDLTEVKDHHGSWLVNRIADEMDNLASECDITILRGNHDGLDPALPFYYFLRHIQRIRWHSLPTERDIPDLGRCLLLPHSSNYKRDWDSINLKSSDFEFIFAHNTFKGATGQNRELDGIPTSVFRKDAQVIAGDVHVPHTVGPVTYVGAPYLIDFGDDYRPRMLLIKKDGRVRSLAAVGPQKRLLEVSDVDQISAGTITGTGDIRPGDILKVRITLTPKQYAEWSEVKRAVLEWAGVNGYHVDQVVPVTERAVASKKETVIRRSSRSDSDILSDYASSRGVDAATLKTGEKFL